MTTLFDADFPFFEIDLPARSNIPDLDDFSSSVPPQTIPGKYDEYDGRLWGYPSLEIVADYFSSRGIPTLGCGQIPKRSSAHIAHFDVYKYLRKNIDQSIKHSLTTKNKAGQLQETSAWDAVVALFSKSPAPAWGLQAQHGPQLICEATLSSVWMKSPNAPLYYVLDQLWVISTGNIRFFVVVEIDGEGKWDDFQDGRKLSRKQVEVQRSRDILSRRVMLYRISSDKCKTLQGAQEQLQILWDRLSAAALLHKQGKRGLLTTSDKGIENAINLV